MYIDILLKWNSRINLTAVRQPEEIVSRHFGESLFAAQYLFPRGAESSGSVIDVGSGAGFPGIPIGMWVPRASITLIESNQKKATFLKEVCRTLILTNINVLPGRAEGFENQAEFVTLRAVEAFEDVVPTASKLTGPGGKLALLIGLSQVKRARELAPGFEWAVPVEIPQSSSRVLLIGSRES